MLKLIVKGVRRSLESYPVYIPIDSLPESLLNYKYKDIYEFFDNPMITQNNKYYFISELSVERSDRNYNLIASKIRDRDMYGNVIVQSISSKNKIL